MAGLIDGLVRRQDWTDSWSEAIQKAVGAVYASLGPAGRSLKSVAHGTLVLRHPLHPALSDVPVGAWTAGVIADYVAHFGRVSESAGDVALATGLSVAVFTVLTGYTDFHETFSLERRYALLHGLAMTAVFAVDAASLGLRWWAGPGLHPLAVGLSTAGWAVLLAGAWLGGHVVFGKGTAVNRAVFLEGPEDWVDAGPSAEIAATGMRCVEAGGMRILLARDGGRVCALAAVCSHAGGPLDEGSLEAGVVTCPWHGSRFRVADGRVVGGPATFDQPRLEVEEADSRLRVRLAEPLH